MKKSFKSCLALMLVCCMMLTMTQQTLYSASSDVKSHWAEKELNAWVKQNLLEGYADGSLHPDALITRAEFITLINKVLRLTDKSKQAFPDVQADAWYEDAISKAYSAGIIQGDNKGNMNPKARITRQEAAVVVAKAFKLEGNASAASSFADASTIADWAKASVGAMKSEGFIAGKGGNKFAPVDSITRAETVKMIDNVMGELVSTKGTFSGDKSGNLVVNAKDVTLSNMTIQGNLYLTQGIGEGDITLQNVKVTGTTFVEGGGPNSIKLENAVLGKLFINKKDGKVRVVFGKGSRAASILVWSGAIVENNSDTALSQVILQGNIDPSHTVTTKGAISKLTLEGKAKVVIISGTIADFIAAANAGGSVVTIEDGAAVTNLTLQAAVTVNGAGTIDNASIQAQGSTLAQKPAHVTFKDGVNAWIAGKNEGATSGSTNPGTTPPTGGGNGSDPNPPTEKAPLLTFPVMSDTHIGINDVSVDAAAKFTQALKAYGDMAKYDAIVINGDMVDSGTEQQYADAMNLLNQKKLTGAKAIITPGNHEYYAAKKELGDDKFKAAERFYDKTGMNAAGYQVEAVDKITEKSGVFFDTWVKGYHFIVMYHDRSEMSDAKYSWLEKKISEDEQGKKADPAKPVFVFSHYPYKGTTYGSEGAGWDNPAQYTKFKTIMAKHQNAMLFTGHTHYTLEHPNTMNADDGFIKINDSAVAFVQAHGYSNDSDIYLDKNKSQGLMVKVYDNKLVIERRELDNNGAVIGVPYVIDLKDPVTSAKKYATDSSNPAFNQNAKLTAASVTAVSATLSWPKAIDDTKVDFYEIKVNNKLIGAPSVISPYVEAASHTFEAKGLTPNTDYTVTIVAHDAYGKVSAPLTAKFKTENAPDGYDPLKADVLDMDFTKLNGKSVLDSTLNHNDAALENNAKVAYDSVFGKQALILDGKGERGKPSSVARVPYNSSMFKQDAVTIETAVYISPDSDLSKDEYHILGNYEDGGYYLYYSTKDKKFVFDIKNSDDPAESDVIPDVKGKMFYLTAVYDGDQAGNYAHGSIKLYVNGVLAGSNTASEPLPINETNDLIIGGDVEGYGDVIHLFEGAINHVKVYSRALSASEVTANFNAYNGAVTIKGGHDIVLFKDEIAWVDVNIPKNAAQDTEAEWDIPKNGSIKESDDHGNRRAIKAEGPGVSTISVSALDQEDTATVTVVNYNIKLTLNSKINKTVDLAPIMAKVNAATDWKSSSTEVAAVNENGIVTALKVGNTVVTAVVNGQTVRTRLIVDPDPDNIEPLPAIDISNRPTAAQTVKPNVGTAQVGDVFQKVVTKYTKSDTNLPDGVKSFINGAIAAPTDKVIPVLEGSLPGEILPVAASDIRFSIVDADQTTWLASSKGVVRVNKSEVYSRDVVQFFNTHRYLPDDDVQFILSDDHSGIWAVTATGVSHIEMKLMGYEDKAQIMSDNLEKNNIRRGPEGQIAMPYLNTASGTPGNYRGTEADNDGLWTADAIAGEMFRTAVEEAKNPNSAQAIEARMRATRSVEADLLLMYVTGRSGQIDVKVKQAPSSSMDIGMMGYSYLRAGGDKNNLNDYVYTGPAATEKRTVQGFISRTMGINKLGFDFHDNSWDGIYYKKGLMIDGKSYSYNTTDSLKDPENTGNTDVRKKGWGEHAGSVINSVNPIPARLAKLYESLGAKESDLYYKGDTSADEILGHMYMYKIAYDTLCTGPNADIELGKLIANAAGEFARHVMDNGYTIVDITGQPTSAGKYDGSTMGQTEDAGEDTPLRAAELMAIFKTAAYVTGNQIFLDEYRKVARDYIYPSVFENQDAYNDVVNGIQGQGPLAGQQALNGVKMPPQNGEAVGYMNRLNQRWASYFYACRRDGDPHPFTWYNYSDERQAMLTYYSLLAIPDQAEDQDIAVMIRAGVDNWYQSNMQYENEPLWDYIYQLAYPNVPKIDLNKAAWVLKRTPIDRTDYSVNLTGRTDISWFVAKAIVDADDGYNNKVSGGDLVTPAGLPAENGIVYDPGKKQYIKKAVKEGDLFVTRTRRQEGRRVQTAVKDDPTMKIAVSPDERPRTRPGDTMFVVNGGDESSWDYGNAYNAPYWMARYYGMISEDTK
ncbi:hypothetical protein Back11_36920 [Paenibacillus baekrokdamisoli]|uniref:Uncharacterized protein n=1 Tax=Paenibacillus baekrokdamisoli TaxID=1712516 RepID=A0A3G9ITZ4_9BACL|nr:S-layer homology domain-containing protein [Paenibacillus baekrokdamisoli]MBB3072601.1 3',5'-cyclic AMP phosphodiesterase CpdA [Paenibacillus baekrokdamisoli]BBH22347.1 hypothetical protein Back11_36920 [Paenibacillus baekrokdamisoli]